MVNLLFKEIVCKQERKREDERGREDKRGEGGMQTIERVREKGEERGRENCIQPQLQEMEVL